VRACPKARCSSWPDADLRPHERSTRAIALWQKDFPRTRPLRWVAARGCRFQASVGGYASIRSQGCCLVPGPQCVARRGASCAARRVASREVAAARSAALEEVEKVIIRRQRDDPTRSGRQVALRLHQRSRSCSVRPNTPGVATCHAAATWSSAEDTACRLFVDDSVFVSYGCPRGCTQVNCPFVCW